MNKPYVEPIEPINDFFVYVEAGFDGEWKHFKDLKAALNEMCYGELYIAYKVDEKAVKELLEEYRNK